MKRFSILTVILSLVSSLTLAYDTTSNLVYSTVNPAPSGESYTWNGFVVTQSTGGGAGPDAGGNVPGYNVSTGTFMFGYSQGTVAYTYALGQALQSSGLNIIGYNYAWEYLNQGQYRGTLSAAVNFTGTNGLSIHNRTWSLGQTGANWETITGTETFANSILGANIANFSLSFSGRDDRFWAGYYGPQVRNPSISLNYEFDACTSNPLSSPTCPGYEAAFQTQQCLLNALFSPACPGYAVAYLNLQCSLNPLYSTTCTGYTQAYFNQQCQLDGLYSKDCPNYNEAYAKKNILYKNETATTIVVQVDPASMVAPLVADPIVNRTITNTGTTANAEANPASPIKLTSPVVSSSTTADTTQTKKSQTNANLDSASGNKTKTTRESLAEKQREKARAEAVTRGKELANEMGKAADMQAQMEVQNVVIQAMGFTPGFDTYAKTLQDGQFYRPYEAYPNQRNIDTVTGRRLFGGSDSVHQQMIDSQYNLGK